MIIKRLYRIVSAAIAAILIMSMTACGNNTSETSETVQSERNLSEDGFDISAAQGFSETTQPVKAKEDILLSPESFYSVYAYMKNATTGNDLLDKNAGDIMFPASMTKVMTALVCIETLADTDELITIPEGLVSSLYEEGASVAGFQEGEQVSVRDLLYGVLLPSGAEACITLARRICGSEEAFANLMNTKAAEIGMTNTHFSNSTGLHSDDNYTTCRDMALLFEYALNNDLFYEIITSASHVCAPTEIHPDGLTFSSTMFGLLGNNHMPNGAVILGGKTGTTDEAGTCLVSFGEFDGCRYILVTGLGQFNEEGIHYNIVDAQTAYSSLV